MRFVTLNEAEDLSQFARRVYRIRSDTKVAEAARILLKANPQLKDPANRRRGMIVIVPEVPGTKLTAATAAQKSLAAQILEQARRGLGDLGDAFTPGLDKQEEEAKQSLEALRSARVRRAAEKIPELKKRVPVISETARAKLKEINTLRQIQKKTVREITKDLDDLEKRIQTT